MKTSSMSLGITTIVFCLFSAGATFGKDLCADPKPGLRTGAPNVDAETFAFSYNSTSYPVDIFSAFAASAHNSGSSYCIRYEAENKGSNSIHKFFWPLAGFQVDTFEPKRRDSIVFSVPGSRAPTVEESWLYAFLSEGIKSYAYQKHSSILFESGIRFAQRGDLPILASVSGPRIAQVNVPLQRFEFKEPTELPEIGSQFSSGGAVVSASSSAKWDGKAYLITLSVDRNDAKLVSSVQAPFAYALPKIKSVSNLLPLLRELQNAELPLPANSYGATAFLPTESRPPTLYVVYQPVTFKRDDGRVCFLAAVYSPIPIPPETLSCRLF